MTHDTTPTGRHCASADRCRAYDRTARPPHPAWVDACPLCDTCLDHAARDIRTLVYDYLDLAQMQLPTLSQAMDTQPRAAGTPPMPLRAEPDALQREIHHVTTLWANELRLRDRLAPDTRTVIVGAWHTTRTNPPPPARPLPGGEVQRAVGVLLPRLLLLASIPPVTVFPAGTDDDPTDMTGWEAIHHLQHLHQRARSMLGRTHRTTELPGTCSACNQDRLCRDEPRYEQDPCDVYCANCGVNWTGDEYTRYVTMLVWPTREPA